MKTALIAGSTGLVGSELLHLLTGHPEYNEIHILVRKPTGINSPKVKEHAVDFDELDNFTADFSPDHVFCTLGTTIKKAGTKDNFKKVDHDYVLALGGLAKEWKAGKFLVVTALGASARSTIFYNRVKGEVERGLINLDLDHLFIFRPSLLMGERKEHRAGEKTAIAVYKVINPLFVGRLKKYKGVPAAQVAKSMMQAALNNNDKLKIYESDEIQDM
jgi:uncharacterized protein YbjT (DUF2867 family)